MFPLSFKLLISIRSGALSCLATQEAARIQNLLYYIINAVLLLTSQTCTESLQTAKIRPGKSEVLNLHFASLVMIEISENSREINEKTLTNQS